jgi:hypothetical protein
MCTVSKIFLKSRHHWVARLNHKVVVRKLPSSVLNTRWDPVIFMTEISLRTQGFSFVRLPTQATKYPKFILGKQHYKEDESAETVQCLGLHVHQT